MFQRTFADLTALNRFLAVVEPGITPLNADMIPGYTGGEITVGVEGASIDDLNNWEEQMNAAQPQPEAVFVADMAENLKSEPQPDSSIEAAFETRMAGLIENTLVLIDTAFKQRDAEIRAHEECHQSYHEELKRARLRGYTEALCAMTYGSNRHLMSVPKDVRDALYQQGRHGIARIDKVEEAHEARNG